MPNESNEQACDCGCLGVVMKIKALPTRTEKAPLDVLFMIEQSGEIAGPVVIKREH